jgi:hypothetical protein
MRSWLSADRCPADVDTVAESYSMGTLSPAEAAAFEERYVGCSRFAAVLEGLCFPRWRCLVGAGDLPWHLRRRNEHRPEPEQQSATPPKIGSEDFVYLFLGPVKKEPCPCGPINEESGADEDDEFRHRPTIILLLTIIRCTSSTPTTAFKSTQN